MQLSSADDDAAADARTRGRPVVGDGSGAHLDGAEEPARVADLLG